MRTNCGLVVTVFAALLLTGCATTAHFSRLPKPDEFKKPLAQLKHEYADLSLFESPSLLIMVFDMPEADALKQAWAEPHDTGFSYFMLLPTMWVFHPTRYWYWEFENKKVSARIDRPFIFGYKPHVWKLKVEENK